MHRATPLLFTIIAFTMCLPCSAASERHRQRNPTDGAGQEHGLEEKWERDPIAFTVHDRETILNYYRGTTSSSPGGPTTKLNRNSVLPIDSLTRLESLSVDLETRLQPLYSGYKRGLIGQDVVILEIRTNRILDIIHNVAGRH